ncbi:MAG TPA: RodZ domain-containing protein [Candidatus Saccharimonadales bacterium]|nr:RodZ domain-containing protein [Candidatus Saccharimonadales bacterium]
MAKKKAAHETQNIGQKLAAARVEKDLSLREIELSTRVRGKYLRAIEAAKYEELPHDVYSRGFISSYARAVGLDPEEILATYDQERGQAEVQLRRQATRLVRPRILLTPRLLTGLGSAVALIGIVGYLIWQFSALTAAPDLNVKAPTKDQELYGSLIEVSGHVGSGADVYVNDSPILTDAGGNFTDSIALQDGVNAIKVTAKNRLGKTTVVTRNILAHVPKLDASQTLPTEVFDGVAVSIQIKDVATSITVTTDGGNTFHGTMLPGTIQVFRGKTKLVISTGNAKATQLTITNSVVANKDFGSLGSSDKPKNDLEFAKDTQFQ